MFSVKGRIDFLRTSNISINRRVNTKIVKSITVRESYMIVM
jgi:hypothetical protein